MDVNDYELTLINHSQPSLGSRMESSLNFIMAPLRRLDLLAVRIHHGSEIRTWTTSGGRMIPHPW